MRKNFNDISDEGSLRGIDVFHGSTFRAVRPSSAAPRTDDWPATPAFPEEAQQERDDRVALMCHRIRERRDLWTGEPLPTRDVRWLDNYLPDAEPAAIIEEPKKPMLKVVEDGRSVRARRSIRRYQP